MMDFSKVRVAVVGDGITDLWHYGRWSKISGEGTPVFAIEKIERSAGGAANVMRNIEALGAKAALYTRRDGWPVKMRFKGVSFRADHEAVEWIDAEQARTILESVKAFKPDIIVISDYAKGICTPWLCQALIATGIPVIVDPKDKDWTKYQGCKVITPNEKEYFAASGGLIFAAMLVTRGALGARLKRRDQIDFDIPATAHEVADVTGAGDTVVATLACCLAVGMEVEQAARIANAAAGVVVQKVGTAVCTLAELEAAL